MPTDPDGDPLPEPHDGMTPEEKGELLLSYLRTGRPTYVFGMLEPDRPLDFSGASLADADLRGVEIWKASLAGANLRGANLEGATLREVDLTEADLTGANLSSACLRNSRLDGAILAGCRMIKAELHGVRGERCHMPRVDLTSANLNYARLPRAYLGDAILRDATMFCIDLCDADLWGAVADGVRASSADLTNARLLHASFRGADLHEAKLRGVAIDKETLVGANLSEADLSGACLSFANLREVSFWRAHLNNASLIAADLSGADLSGTQLDGADLDGANLDGASFSGAVGAASRSQAKLTAKTFNRSEWSGLHLSEWLRAGAVMPEEEYALLPVSVRDALERAKEGITLTFDTRLHPFDPAAFTLLIAEILGDRNDVTVEERSSAAGEPPAWIRINGSRAEDLLAVAEAFYERVWRSAEAVVEERALQKAMSSGVALLVARLDEMRDHLVEVKANVAILGDEDVRETITDKATEHVRAKWRKEFSTRLQRIADGLLKEVPKKLIGTLVGESAAEAAGDVVGDVVAKALGAAAESAVEPVIDVGIEEARDKRGGDDGV